MDEINVGGTIQTIVVENLALRNLAVYLYEEILEGEPESQQRVMRRLSTEQPAAVSLLKALIDLRELAKQPVPVPTEPATIVDELAPAAGPTQAAGTEATGHPVVHVRKPGARRPGRQPLPEKCLVDALVRFLRSNPSGFQQDYIAWRAAYAPDAPSFGTLAKRYGSWSEAVALGHERLRELVETSA